MRARVVVPLFAAAHLLPLTVNGPVYEVDTVDYAAQGHAGPFSRLLWMGPKPPLTGLLHWACTGNHWAIVVVQALVAGVCWAALALAICVRQRACVFGVVALLVMSLVPAFQYWDTALLSDSLSISLGVLLVACVIRYGARPSRGRLSAIAATALLAALVRDTNGIIIAFAAVLVAAIAIVRPLVKKEAGRSHAALAAAAAAFVVVVAVQPLQIAAHRTRVGAMNEIQLRVLTDPVALRFYKSRGMPVPPAVWRYAGRFDLAPERDRDPRLDGLRQWSEEHGLATRAAWTIRHPRWALLSAFTDDSAAFRHRFREYYRPFGYHESIPYSAANVIRTTGAITLPLEVAAAIALGLLGLRRADLLAWAGLGLLALTVPHAILVWNADAADVSRHGLTMDAQLRVALILLAASVASSSGARGSRGPRRAAARAARPGLARLGSRR